MSKMARDKGKRGQREFSHLLKGLGWTMVETRCGAEEEDFLGIAPSGQVYSIEVKNCVLINQTAFLKQAKEQAVRRGKTKWMLACSLQGFKNTFLVITSETAQVWCEEMIDKGLKVI